MDFNIRGNITKLLAFIKLEWKFLIVVVFLAITTYEIIQIERTVSTIGRQVSSLESDVSSIESDVSSIQIFGVSITR